MRTNKKLLLLLFQFTSFFSFSQQHNTPIQVPFEAPKSPNVASLGTYLEVPTTLSTGQVNFSIPIYSFEIGKLTIPLSLQYSNTGLKVADIPSWVGHGWNLLAGGMITRTVRGLPDDDPGEGLIHHYSSLERAYKNQMGGSERYQYFRSIVEGEIDAEYDVYNYEFLGRSGSFYINKNGVAIQMPKSALKVTPIITSNVVTSFTIVDEQGHTYFFTLKEVSTSTTSDGVLFASNYYNSQSGAAWHLTKVVTKNNQEIVFEYNQYSMSYKEYIEYEKIERRGERAECRTNFPSSAFIREDIFVTVPVFQLKKITWPNGRIEFIPGESRQDLKALNNAIEVPYLKELKVFDNQNNLKHQVGFTIAQGNRLKLNSVKFYNVLNQQADQEFKLGYYNESSWPSLNRDNNAQDIWGYYNGKSQSNLLPASLVRHTVLNGFTSVASADRSVSEGHAKTGMLKEVVYPTGGKTSFEYESNKIFYPDYNSIPLVLKASVNIPYQNIYSASAHTDGNQTTSADASGSFVLTQFTPAVKIHMNQLITDPSGFATTTARINELTEWNLNNDCQTSTVMNNSAYNTNTDCLLDLPAGTYHTTINASSYDNFMASAYITVDAPVTPQNLMVDLGGLRVKKIAFIDSVKNQHIIKTYSYEYTGEDQIKLKYLPNFISSVQRNFKIGGTTNGCNDCNDPNLYTLHSSSVSPMPGYPIEYPKVTETIGENGENGQIVHYFSTSDYIGGFQNKPYANPAYISWIGGLENKKETSKKESATATTLVQEETTAYGGSTPNFNDLDMSLKVGVANMDYCLGYPAVLIPENDTHGSLTISRSFVSEFVPMYTTDFNLIHKQVKNLSQVTGQIPLLENVSYLYESVTKTVPSEIRKSINNNHTAVTKNKYAKDYTIPSSVSLDETALAIKQMQEANQVATPIEVISIREDGNGNKYVTEATLTTFATGSILPKQVFQVKPGSLIPLASFTPSYINSSGSFIKDTRYKEEVAFKEYDTYQNLLEHQKQGDVNTSYIWGYNKTHPTAQVLNATSDQIAYTSFETEDQGGWSISNGTVGSTNLITGKKTFSGTLMKSVPQGNYMVTLWAAGSVSVNSIAGAPLRTSPRDGAWRYYEWKLDNVNAISVNAATMDEVRLYPIGAQMITYTYEPLVGMTAQVDMDNNITYYEYDGLGRLSSVRDEAYNTVKKYCYNYKGQVEECGQFDPNPRWQATGATRCKSCEANASYTSTMQQREEKDSNPQSATYNQLRWIDNGVNSSCVSPADWQYTATSIRCRVVNGINTGEQEREQQDKNPCSATGGQFRWVVVGTDCMTCAKPQNWQPTGSIRCAIGSTGQNTGYQEREERNIESCSPTSGQTRWVMVGQNCTTCPKPQNWQATGNYRCAADARGQNSGIQEREERNTESCSSGYNTTRWVSNGTNTTACPLPVYARLSYENVWGDYYTHLYGDIVVRLYSDYACTIPISVTGLQLNYDHNDVCANYYYQGSVTVNGNYVVIQRGARLLYQQCADMWCEYYQTCYPDFVVTPGMGYTTR